MSAMLAVVLFAVCLVLIALFLTITWVRDKSPSRPLCGCGQKPEHSPSIESCRRVNEAAGRVVTPMGFVISRDGSLFYDGSKWLPNPGYKPTLDAENFEPLPYGRGAQPESQGSQS